MKRSASSIPRGTPNSWRCTRRLSGRLVGAVMALIYSSVIPMSHGTTITAAWEMNEVNKAVLNITGALPVFSDPGWGQSISFTSSASPSYTMEHRRYEVPVSTLQKTPWRMEGIHFDFTTYWDADHALVGNVFGVWMQAIHVSRGGPDPDHAGEWNSGPYLTVFDPNLSGLTSSHLYIGGELAYVRLTESRLHELSSNGHKDTAVLTINDLNGPNSPGVIDGGIREVNMKLTLTHPEGVKVPDSGASIWMLLGALGTIGWTGRRFRETA